MASESERGEVILSWETDDGATRWMVFDVVESINHISSVEVTESPIEDGTSVADHAFNAPDMISITGLVSNTPLPSNPAVGEANTLLARSALMRPTNITFDLPKPKPRLSQSSLIRAGVSAVGDALGFNDDQNTAAGLWQSTSGYLDRCREAFDILREVKRTFRRIRIQTELHSYDEMVIRTLTVPETVEDGTVKSFRIEMKELFTASLKTVKAPDPVEIRAKPPTKKPKSTKEGDNQGDRQEAAKKSLAASGVDSILGGLGG